MLSWLLPYLTKGHRPDFNNGPEGYSSNGRISLGHLFKPDSNNGPSPGHSNFVCYSCSGLLLMLFWQVPYLGKGHRPDFNNSPGGYSNNGRILTSGVYSNLTRIMAPPQAIPILNCKHELARKLF